MAEEVGGLQVQTAVMETDAALFILSSSVDEPFFYVMSDHRGSARVNTVS